MTVQMASLLELAQSGDKDAQTRLVEENAGLIWGIVRRYYGRGVDADDLYQLGCIGFIKAVHGFDLTYGTEFSTYSVPKIDGEIRRYFRDSGSIKISRSIKSNVSLLYRYKADLESKLGREPTLSEIAEASGLSVEDILQAEQASWEVGSIQEETGDGMTLEGMLAGDSSEEGWVEKITLREAIESLPEREKITILLRYYRAFTQTQTAKVLKVSQVQVSRLEKRAIEKLRQYYR